MTAALQRMGGDAKLLRQVVEMVREDTPDLISKLRAAASEENATDLKAAAHNLKGLLVNFDADAASQAAIEIERLADAGQLQGVDVAIRSLEDELNRLWPELEAECRRI